MAIELSAALLLLLHAAVVLASQALFGARRSVLRDLARQDDRAQAALALVDASASTFATLGGLLTGTAALFGALGTMALASRSALTGEHIVLAAALAVLTLLLLGELLPRTLAGLAPERIACRIALPLRRFLRAITWLAMPFSRPAAMLLRAMRHKEHDEAVSRTTLLTTMSRTPLEPNEHRLLNRVARLGERTAETLMTPRTKIAWLDMTASREENLEVMREHPYSRYPVYRGSDNDIAGIMESRNLARLAGRTDADLFANLVDPLFVTESTSALTLLETLREEGAHMALVVDEYGDLQGLVTLDDLLDAVMGQIRQQQDDGDDDARVVQRDDGSWLVDGGLASADLCELLGLPNLPGEHDHDFNTAAGMVVAWFGRIPAPGEAFTHEGWRIEVVDLDGARIDKLLVQRASGDPVGPA